MLGFNIVLERARKGNEQSLMRLYDLCCDTVFNASYRIVLNAQDAEEITQDAFLKTFENLDSFSGSERDFVAFVKTVAINKSIDMFRKRSKEPFYTEIDTDAAASAVHLQIPAVPKSSDRTVRTQAGYPHPFRIRDR